MEFKKLELEPEQGRIKRIIKSPHIRRTLLAVIFGALAGFLFYYFTEGKHLDALVGGEIIKSLVLGGFFGFFVTNSPCARGRC